VAGDNVGLVFLDGSAAWLGPSQGIAMQLCCVQAKNSVGNGVEMWLYWRHMEDSQMGDPVDWEFV
jgi:hypothetical protein